MIGRVLVSVYLDFKLVWHFCEYSLSHIDQEM